MGSHTLFLNFCFCCTFLLLVIKKINQYFRNIEKEQKIICRKEEKATVENNMEAPKKFKIELS